MSIGSTSRLLILGAGPVIADLYAPALRALKWGNRVTVVDTTATALERAASALPGASLLQRTWEEALDCDKANFTAAIVALPNRLHASATQRSISAGLHVLCEKPLTLKLDEVSQTVLIVGLGKLGKPSFEIVNKHHDVLA